ncbi:hypothetical protein Chor_000983 [Crotalus horridus]
MSFPSFLKTVGSCFQEQLRLQAQLRLLEHSVKQQQARIVNLLMERDIQNRDKEGESSVINLGEETKYKGNYTLKIDLSDFMDEQRFAQYEKFQVADEQNFYKMNCGQYSGTAGDSLTGGFHPEVKWWANHQGMKFSTKDRDNDNYEKNCAEEDHAGWWFNRCHTANLNGLYYNGPYSARTDDGIVWYTWRGWWYSLKSVVMKIRPSNFSPSVA